MNIGLTFLGILLFLTSTFMMMLILVQRGKGGGLTGALGGMGGQSAFGSKAGDVFTRITIVTAIIWITLCMITIAAYNPPPKDNLTKKEVPSLESLEEDEEGGMGGMSSTGDSNDASEGSAAAGATGEIDEELSELIGDGEATDSAADDSDSESDETLESEGPKLVDPDEETEGSGDQSDDEN